MKRRIRFILIALAGMTMVSCGVEKVTTISQVEDAHFKYEDIRFEWEQEEPHGSVLYFSGKITNNSGINLEADFDIFCDDEHIGYVDGGAFGIGETVTVDRVWITSSESLTFNGKPCDVSSGTVRIEYEPRYE